MESAENNPQNLHLTKVSIDPSSGLDRIKVVEAHKDIPGIDLSKIMVMKKTDVGEWIIDKELTKFLQNGGYLGLNSEGLRKSDQSQNIVHRRTYQLAWVDPSLNPGKDKKLIGIYEEGAEINYTAAGAKDTRTTGQYLYIPNCKEKVSFQPFGGRMIVYDPFFKEEVAPTKMGAGRKSRYQKVAA